MLNDCPAVLISLTRRLLLRSGRNSRVSSIEGSRMPRSKREIELASVLTDPRLLAASFLTASDRAVRLQFHVFDSPRILAVDG